MNSNETQQPGFFESLIQDDGVQRAAAGVVVAVVVAVAKNVIFSKAG
ncbi:MAG: hypothetical protein K8H88_31105 [Sandaracinaceae bacterium]|nr:hypothetical protein [Sandaracinaceae bacterium]